MYTRTIKLNWSEKLRNKYGKNSIFELPPLFRPLLDYSKHKIQEKSWMKVKMFKKILHSTEFLKREENSVLCYEMMSAHPKFLHFYLLQTSTLDSFLQYLTNKTKKNHKSSPLNRFFHLRHCSHEGVIWSMIQHKTVPKCYGSSEPRKRFLHTFVILHITSFLIF